MRATDTPTPPHHEYTNSSGPGSPLGKSFPAVEEVLERWPVSEGPEVQTNLSGVHGSPKGGGAGV